MTRATNTKSTNTQLNDVEEADTEMPSVPMILKLVSGEELIVSGLMRDEVTNDFLITNPYVVLRQVIQGTPHLYLSKWISYAGSEVFMLSRNAVMTINIPNTEILTHYNTCIEEEFMDEHNPATTHQISVAKH
jgi:hypothetical protein